MIARLKRLRRTVPRHHAADALRQGLCLFACRGDCAPDVCPVGLRGSDDVDLVLVCATHVRDLRRLRAYEAERLARYLRVTFGREPARPVRDRETGVLVV